jgi:superfamily II DNA/RNA helicase
MTARRPRSTPTPPATTFADLGVPAVLTRVLAAAGVTTPFPIQAATLPDALAGRDVLGRGQTGSGKTYAFVLPLLARLAAGARRPGRPRALILAPTRELATQIHTAMAPLAQPLSLRTLTIFGGVKPARDIAGLRVGVDVLVACPGRLADHAEAGHVDLSAVEITVLDEADHMADLGFLPVVTRLLECTPRNGQRLLFSATLDGAVDVLVRRFLTNPVRRSVDPAVSSVPAVSHHVLHVHAEDRFAVLADLTAAPGRTIVFTRTKHGARTLTRRLVAAGVPAVELHGNLAQSARSRNLQAFTSGAVSTLVATDIAARGIHVDDVALVIHADPPAEYKAYLHRSGRTARAGAPGTVVTLMTDAQVPEVNELTRKAGITATITRARPGDQLLTQFAPGHRPCLPTPPVQPTQTAGPALSSRASRTHTSRGLRRAGQGSTPPPPAAGPGSAHNATATPTTGTRLSGAAAFSSRARVGRR